MHPESAFRRAIRGLSTDRFIAFVADLWRARDREVERGGGPVLSVRTPAGQVRRVCVRGAGDAPPSPGDFDALVVATDEGGEAVGADTDVVGPADLHRILHYAIERPDRSRLVSTYLPEVAGDHADEDEDHVGGGDEFPAATADTSGVDGDEPAASDEADHVPEIPTPVATPEPTSDGADEAPTPLDLYDPDPGRGADGGPVDPTSHGPASDGSESREDAAERPDGPDGLTSALGGMPVSRRGLLVGGGLALGAGAVLDLALDTGASGETDPVRSAELGPVSVDGTVIGENAGRARPSIAVPGVSPEGVVDPDALAAAQRDFLLNTHYTLVDRHEIRDTTGALRSTLVLDFEMDTDRSYLTRVSVEGVEAPDFFGDPPLSAAYYAEGDRVYASRSQGGDREFRAAPPSQNGLYWAHWAVTVPYRLHHGGPRSFYSDLFRSTPTQLVPRTRAEGDSRHRVINQGDRPRGGYGPFERWLDLSGIRDLSVSAALDDICPIPSLTMDFVAEIGLETVTVERTLEYRDVGRTTVERPDWFARARAEIGDG